MKKVLVIAYYWPPAGGGGVQRWVKFVKYLRDFDWEPVVFVPANADYPQTDPTLGQDLPADLTIIRQPIFEVRRLFKKLVGGGSDKGTHQPSADELFYIDPSERSWKQNLSLWIRGNLFIPDARVSWVSPSVRFLKRFLQTGEIDAIATTGPPHSVHLIGRALHRKTGIAWLADFRDPWTEIEFYPHLMLTKWADAKHRRLESLVLKEADAVTVVSPSWAEMLANRREGEVHTLTNGFDPADFPNTPPASHPKFSICHAGTLAEDRDPVGLWSALKQLKEKFPDFESDLQIDLLGKTAPGVLRSIEAEGLASQTVDHGYVSHEKAIEIMRSSKLNLLILNRAEENVAGRIPGKIFEYLAAGPPILLIGPSSGDAAAIVVQSGGAICNWDEPLDAAVAIAGFYQRWKTGNEMERDVDLTPFTRRELTRQLAAILDEIATGKT